MLSNVDLASNLRAVARAKARDFETRTVHPRLADEMMAQGWTLDKKNKASVRLRRGKQPGTLLEDRVWSLLYRMGFPTLSGEGGGTISISTKEEERPRTQIDVVGIDDEVALAIECKSAQRSGRRPQFQEELGKHSLVRDPFSRSVASQFEAAFKRQVILAMFRIKYFIIG